MKVTASILAVFICFAMTGASGQEIYQQVRVYYSDMSDLQLIHEAGIPLDHVRVKKGVFVDVVATRTQVAKLRELGMRLEILEENLTRFYKKRFQPTQKFHGGFELGSMGGNYTYDEMTAELDSLHVMYPTLVSEKTSIGLSLEGRDIWAVKLSDNVTENENVGGDLEPLALYTGVTRAREPLGMMNLIYFMYHLCENYGRDDLATFVLENRELWFVPVLNPDGYVYNERIAPQGGGMHRKNRRETNCAEETSRGVDLNRNYSYDWGLNNLGSSPDPCSNVFRGDSAFSEPETAVIREFMESKDFKNVLHYHAYSNLLLHSYGTGEYPPEPDLTMLRAYGAEMTKFNHYRVGTGLETLAYPVNGDAVDFSYGGLGLIAYTPEVGTSDDFFWPSTDRIVPLCEENVWPNLYFARIAGTLLKIEHVQISPEQVDPGDPVTFSVSLMNAGLRSSFGNVNAAFSPLSATIDFDPVSADLGVLDKWESIDFPVSLTGTVDPSAVAGCPAGLLVTMEDGEYESYVDTISVLVGSPSLLAVDDAESGMENWETARWGLSSDSHEGVYSLTDSPGRDYGRNARNDLTLAEPLDLTGASHSVLRFWAKWDIEAVWDFVQVRASTDGLDWIPLWGEHMVGGSGSGVQPRGEPGYDGTQLEWVPETVDLSHFDGEPEVFVGFVLRSDQYVQGDGFYLDDLEVVSYPAFEIAGGDVTRDCVIDVADVSAAVDMILEPDLSSALERQLADVNSDRSVDIFDIVLLVDTILGNAN
ncbi:MAG: M14 family zinc carboxypeptidase [Candidatus Neomarinimicrobiota bacterium]